MFPNRALAATTLALGAAVLISAAPAAAWPFGGSPKPSQTPQTQTGPAATTDPKSDAAPDAPPKKASPEQRALAARQPPLVRAAFWQRELAADPTDVEAGLGLSNALRALGKTDEAAEIADRMVTVQPKNLDVLLEDARTHIVAGHGFYSIPPLREAMKIAPKDWRPVSLLAVAYEQDERPDDALAMYAQALKLSPDNPAVLTNLALFNATRNNMAEAERLLRKAAAQPTATARERQNLALVLGLEGKAAEAETWMRQDLPPEATTANLAYFRPSSAPGLPASRPAADPPKAEDAQAAKPPARTWKSMQEGGPGA